MTAVQTTPALKSLAPAVPALVITTDWPAVTSAVSVVSLQPVPPAAIEQWRRSSS